MPAVMSASAWIAISFFVLVVLVSAAMLVALLIYAYSLPANSDWHLTYVVFSRTDAQSGLRIRGNIMMRKKEGKRFYRALDQQEAELYLARA